MNFLSLPREEYDYYELHYTYSSRECYRVQRTDNKETMSVSFRREALPEVFHRSCYDTLYQPYWHNCEAFGVKNDDGNLVAFLEIEREEWNNRLRITQLLVDEHKRGQGIGKFLIEKAKEMAECDDYRLIVLETQSCNIGAIDFYRSQGFTFAGTDLFFYSNNDISEDEVMLEMVYLF